MGIVIALAIGCLSGFILFRRRIIPIGGEPYEGGEKLSVIIPARNEEKNLTHILDSLLAQSHKPYEIIVVDDFSQDKTREIAEGFGAEIKLIENKPLPPGWTGKTWAVWNGYLHSTGDVIAFLDADIRLAPRALESLLKARAETGGVISVVPFHHTEKFYERWALVANVLGIFAFTSPFERNNRQKGLYGSCIMTTRQHYEAINGHDSIRSEVMDDLSLGAKYREAGIAVTNFIGCGLVSFRMYPDGIKSEWQGFGKSAVLGTSKISVPTVILAALWLLGLIAAESAVFLWNTSWAYPLLFGYILYTLQLFYLIKYVGDFGKVIPLIHVLSTLFFLAMYLYSAYQVVFLGRVSWKGRNVRVKGRGGI